MRGDNHWLEWAKELQFLAQSALAYCRDPYDIDRFHRIREISAGMLADLMDQPIEKVRAVFLYETGYQTPKMDVRAASIQDGKVLLVRENNGLWVLPGGWIDADQTIASNAVKETREEAGWEVRPVKLVAMLDHNRHNTPPSVQEITSAFVLCEPIRGEFVPNTETVESRFFGLDELPELFEQKTTTDQIRLCFDAWADPHWQTIFD